jgi:hypothetical protein
MCRTHYLVKCFFILDQSIEHVEPYKFLSEISHLFLSFNPIHIKFQTRSQ